MVLPGKTSESRPSAVPVGSDAHVGPHQIALSLANAMNDVASTPRTWSTPPPAIGMRCMVALP